MVDYIKQPAPLPVATSEERTQQGREDHAALPEAVRFENALRIWVRDLRAQELGRVAAGGRLTVAALGYEEVLKLRQILIRVMADRKRRIRGRWMRRKERRDARGICLSCEQPRYAKPICTVGRQCVAAGRDSTRD